MSKLPEDLIVMNCANCGQLIQLPKLDQPTCKKLLLPTLGKRLDGRPWCKGCLAEPQFHENAAEFFRTEGQRHGLSNTRS